MPAKFLIMDTMDGMVIFLYFLAVMVGIIIFCYLLKWILETSQMIKHQELTIKLLIELAKQGGASKERINEIISGS